MGCNVIPRKKQSGFSLVELMIAMILGLFIIGGVIAVFIGSSASFRSNDALSKVQENGRFALELIAHDLRNVGYKGSCYKEVFSVLDTADADYEADAHDINEPIVGWADDDGEFFAGSLNNYVDGTDIVLIKHAAETAEVTLFADVGQSDTSFTVTTNQVANEQIIIFSDGLGCNMFQNTSSGAASTLIRGTTGGDINNFPATASGALFTQSFDKDETDINELTSHLYYIGQGTASSTALRRLSYGRGALGPNDNQELVEDITSMTIRYGIASGAVGTVLDYSSAATDIADWDDVLAVRVTLTVTGDENIQHTFSTTVALRNRLLGL